jgi:5,10-methylene-tetrahydrofolate dehydrogenase/methenyl tetrahydrofolate cyclohydrolase
LIKGFTWNARSTYGRKSNRPENTRRSGGGSSQADILVAAIGKMEMVRGDCFKPGAAVIDVGINKKPDPTKKKGYRLVGDVNY